MAGKVKLTEAQTTKCLQAVAAIQSPSHKDQRLLEFCKELGDSGYDTIGVCLRESTLKWDAKSDIVSLTDAGRAHLASSGKGD